MIQAEPIFEVLHGVPSREAISAIHLTVRWITHAAALHGFTGDLDRSFLATNFSEVDKARAQELIDVIEQQENVLLRKIDRTKVEAYVKLLVGVLYKLTAKEFPHNDVRGNQLLAQLRAA